ncbi:hypothetical protein EYF80_033768 [Liparis tanakae]|uniref:Uncharacterized protein n=1 Tax=Liparis tanakae TaxID=230148 RepID=A0A4Z2GTK2_9TELE|nr:hypothetical protein EYF80_033768 [Liparis tanakae]
MKGNQTRGNHTKGNQTRGNHTKRVAGGAAALVRQLSQLDDRHADDAVLAGEAVVLYGDVQLVGLRAVFVTENAGRDDTRQVQPTRGVSGRAADTLISIKLTLMVGSTSCPKSLAALKII